MKKKTFKYSNICLYLFYQRLVYHTCTYIFVFLSCTYILLIFLSNICVYKFFYHRSRDCYVYIFLLGSAFSKLMGCSVLLLFAFSSVFVCSCACPLLHSPRSNKSLLLNRLNRAFCYVSFFKSFFVSNQARNR